MTSTFSSHVIAVTIQPPRLLARSNRSGQRLSWGGQAPA